MPARPPNRPPTTPSSRCIMPPNPRPVNHIETLSLWDNPYEVPYTDPYADLYQNPWENYEEYTPYNDRTYYIRSNVPHVTFNKPLVTAKYPSVSNTDEGYEESEKVEFSALRGYGRFGTNSIQVVFDTGSGISIMSRRQATKLRLNIKKPKRLDVIIIGGIRSSVTGRVDNAPFMVMDVKAPIEKLYIVDTNDELLIPP